MRQGAAIAKHMVERILAWSAQRVLSAEQPMVVGVTGSAGKTSTKVAIGHVLRAVLRNHDIRVAAGNLNTEFGLPLAILGIEKPERRSAWVSTVLRALGRAVCSRRTTRPKVLVLEYGVEQPGDIKALVRIARPDIAVVTNVGSAHTQFLGSVDAVEREKGTLVRALKQSGLAILNRRDVRVKRMLERTKARVVFVDADPANLSIALAVAVAEHGFGITPGKAHTAMRNWKRPVGRLQLLAGTKGSWVLDDTYNANPLSTTLALNELKRLGKQKRAKRLIAVLGDMLELGEEEFKVHKGVALLAERVADYVVLAGPRFRRTKQGDVWFPGPQPAAAHLLSLVQRGDMILVKGSQSMRMEKVTEVLLKDPKQAPKLLVRQSEYWQEKPYVTP